MNEIQRVRDFEDQARIEADAAFETWWKYLPSHGTNWKYWKRVHEMEQGIVSKYGEYGRHLVSHRLRVLEDESKRIHPPAPNVIMEEVFNK